MVVLFYRFFLKRVSIDGSMDKENVVGIHNGILYSAIKKEGNPAICGNMEEPGEHYAE